MRHHQRSWLAIFTLIILALTVTAAGAQGPAKGKSAVTPPPPGRQITLEGTIIHSPDFGGYVLITQAPHEEHKIINENAKILDPLVKQGKKVTVTGRLVRGAYLLFVETIDGRKYQGGK